MAVAVSLLRRLGVRDAILIVMGGIIGSGIFMNPSVVAKHLNSSALIMLAWSIGAVIALLGAFLFAELASRRPLSGGLYAYLRDAFHPVVGFMYGWTMLFVSQGGGIAASAVTFAAYFTAFTGSPVSEKLLAVVLIAAFTIINALGVRAGAGTQNLFMAIKIVAIGGFVVAGLFVVSAVGSPATTARIQDLHANSFVAIALAIVPIMFAYNGWQTATFLTGEMKTPERTLPIGLIVGVLLVAVLYLAVNAVCLHALGPTGLAATKTPASDVARVAFGPMGSRMMAFVVMFSTVGFISNQMLVSARVPFQMAADGTFFDFLARVNPRTHVPVSAIVQQGILATVIALSGTYEQILTYVVSVDFVFYALAGVALFVFRKRDHVRSFPWVAFVFIGVVCAVLVAVIVRSPVEGLTGLGVIATGAPAYLLFARFKRMRRV